MLQLSPLRCWRKGVRRVSARAHGCSALGLNIISFLHTGNIKWQLRGRSAFQLLVEREGAPPGAGPTPCEPIGGPRPLTPHREVGGTHHIYYLRRDRLSLRGQKGGVEVSAVIPKRHDALLLLCMQANWREGQASWDHYDADVVKPSKGSQLEPPCTAAMVSSLLSGPLRSQTSS